MRRVFASMEGAGNNLIASAGIAPFDERLRRFREMALVLFDKAWSSAIRKGIAADEEDAAVIYTHCLAHILSTRGIALPAGFLPTNEAIQALLKEVLR